MRSIPLLVAALLGGCAADPGDTSLEIVFDPCQPLRLVPSADATTAELASTDHAIDMWNRLGRSSLVRDGVDPAADPAMEPIEIRFESAAALFHGVYDDERGVVFINRVLADDHQRSVTIAHELGHAFGLFHITDRVSAMNPENLVVEPNQEDAQDLDALWGDCSR